MKNGKDHWNGSPTRREILKMGVGALGVLSVVEPSPGSTPPQGRENHRRPNIVFFLGEGLRTDELSIAGNKILHTPNMDRIAREGITFSSEARSRKPGGPIGCTSIIDYPDNLVVPHRGIRTERYKFIHYYQAPEEFELYDLGQDPGELNNLYGDPRHAGLTRDLLERIHELRQATGDRDDPPEHGRPGA